VALYFIDISSFMPLNLNADGLYSMQKDHSIFKNDIRHPGFKKQSKRKSPKEASRAAQITVHVWSPGMRP